MRKSLLYANRSLRDRVQMTQILPAHAADELPLGFALDSMGTGMANWCRCAPAPTLWLDTSVPCGAGGSESGVTDYRTGSHRGHRQEGEVLQHEI
jgi:hypothetical protein